MVPRRVLVYNPWKKEIEKWLSDATSEVMYITGYIPPKEREHALSTFKGSILIMTAGVLNNDFILRRINLEQFSIIVFDEAHKIVSLGEEAGCYRYAVYYKYLVLNLINSYNTIVLGLTIPGSERTVETKKHLTAVGISSDAAVAPMTRTYVIKLDSTYAKKLDLWFSFRMASVANVLREVLDRKIPWRINEDRLFEILEEKNVSEQSYAKYISALRTYRTLFQVRQDVWEGNNSRAIKKLSENKDRLCRNDRSYYELIDLINGAAVDKRFGVALIILPSKISFEDLLNRNIEGLYFVTLYGKGPAKELILQANLLSGEYSVFVFGKLVIAGKEYNAVSYANINVARDGSYVVRLIPLPSY